MASRRNDVPTISGRDAWLRQDKILAEIEDTLEEHDQTKETTP